MALAAGVHVAACLLALAGGAKLTSPAGTRTALRLAGLPHRTGLVRALGAGEILLAGCVLLLGGPLSAAGLAVAYAGFAVFAARQRRTGAACGCFGDERTPMTPLHVATDTVMAGAALIAVVAPVAGLPVLLAGRPMAGAAELAALGVATGLLRTALTALPDLAEALSSTHPGADG